MERESIIFYRSWADATSHLPTQERGEILTAIIDYAMYGKKPVELNGTSRAVFTIIRPLIDANNKRYINGRRGGSKKGVSNNPFGRRGRTTKELPMVDNLTTDGSLGGTTKELPNNKCNLLNDKCNTLNELSNDNIIRTSKEDAMSVLRTKTDAEESSRKQKIEERKTANAVIDYYNEQIKTKSARLATCAARTDRRVQCVMARIDEYGEENVRKMIDKAVASRFLNYEASNAPVGIDWIMRPNNFPKVLEGNYDNKTKDPLYDRIHFEGEHNPHAYDEDKEIAKRQWQE